MGLLQIIECKNIIYVFFEMISPLKKSQFNLSTLHTIGVFFVVFFFWFGALNDVIKYA